MKFKKGQSVKNPFSKRSGVITGFSRQRDGMYLLLDNETEPLSDGHEDYWELAKQETDKHNTETIKDLSNGKLLSLFDDAVCDSNYNPTSEKYNKSEYSKDELRAEILNRMKN